MRDNIYHYLIEGLIYLMFWEKYAFEIKLIESSSLKIFARSYSNFELRAGKSYSMLDSKVIFVNEQEFQIKVSMHFALDESREIVKKAHLSW